MTSFLGGGDLSFERNFLFVRPAIAALVALSAVIQGDGVPGRAGVLAGCSTAVLYNFLLAYFVSRRRIYMLRVTSLLFDNLVVMVTSLFVFYRMGRVGYETDLWLRPLALGAPLPTLPLRLTGDLFVAVDFEAAYQEACRRRRLA